MSPPKPPRTAAWRPLFRGTAAGRNLTWLSGERLLQLVAGLTIGAAVARHLGAEDYGRLAFALSFVALLAPFSSAGDGLAVRDMEAGTAPPETVLANTAVLAAGFTLTGASIMAGAGLLIPSFLPPDSALLVLIVLIGPLGRPLAVVDYWFQVTMQARRAVVARNTSFLTGMAARVVAIALDAPVLAFACIIAAEALLSTSLLVLAYRRSGGRLRGWRTERLHLRSLARQALPLVLAGLSVSIYLRVDQVMLGALSGIEQNGIYAVGVLLAEVSWFLPVAVLVSLTPGMTRLWNRDRAAYDVRLQQLFTLAAGASYVIVAGSILVGFWFIPLAYGEQFRDTVPVFVLLTFATPFVFIGVMQSLWTINEGRQGLALARTGLGAVVNVVANLLLLPRYGALGAGITTVLAQVVAALLANALFVPTRKVLRMQLRALRLHGIRTILRDPAAALRPEISAA